MRDNSKIGEEGMTKLVDRGGISVPAEGEKGASMRKAYLRSLARKQSGSR